MIAHVAIEFSIEIERFEPLVVHQDGYIKWIRAHVGHELIYLVYSVGIILDDENFLHAYKSRLRLRKLQVE